MTDPKTHWENIYKTKSSQDVSWYSPHLKKSLEIISSLNLSKDAEIIDIGGGASTLPDDLLDRGFKGITVLDISYQALQVSKNRLGNKAKFVQWLEKDILKTAFKPSHYDLWHDRAVFHFLTNPSDRVRYIEQLKQTLKPDGYVILSTFSLKGPLKCSGLDIVRYSAETLHVELGDSFHLIQSTEEEHPTPFGTMQAFVYCVFKRSKP